MPNASLTPQEENKIIVRSLLQLYVTHTAVVVCAPSAR
jgi:hypothetical protein